MRKKLLKLLVISLLTIIILFASTFIITGLANNTNLEIFLREMAYKTSEEDAESLLKLCLVLFETDKFDKQIYYFEKILSYDLFEEVASKHQLISKSEEIPCQRQL